MEDTAQIYQRKHSTIECILHDLQYPASIENQELNKYAWIAEGTPDPISQKTRSIQLQQQPLT